MRTLLLLLCLVSTVIAQGQITEGYPFPAICMDPENIMYEHYIAHPNSELCYHNEDPFLASLNGVVDLRSPERIHLKENVRITGLNTAGRMHAKIEAAPFDVRVMSHDLSTGPIVRNEKFEIGIRPPADIMNRIQTFIDYTMDKDYPHPFYSGSNPYEHKGWEDLNGINPFMSWELRVHAQFELVDENWSTVETKHYEGFFFEDWQRTETTGDDWDDEWEQVNTELPFRVRAALGKQGMWRCKFFIDLDEQPFLESGSYYVNVINAGGEGFVKVAPNKQFFEKDGESYFPVGRNIHQTTCNRDDDPLCDFWEFTPALEEINGPQMDPWHNTPYAFHKFEKELEEYYDEGCRHFRYITVHDNDDIEFELLGNYYKRLKLANETDRLIELVESMPNMHMHWVLNIGRNLYQTGPYHGWNFDWDANNLRCNQVTPNEEWHGFKDAVANPYHKFIQQQYFDETIESVEDPMDFITNELCWKYYKEKLRYTIARWGYSTRISEMDLMSEINDIGDEYQFFYDPNPTGNQENCRSTGKKYHPYSGEAKKLSNPSITTYETEQELVNDPENSTQPFGDEIAVWQSEMARYIKEDLQHEDHLIGISYTGPMLPAPDIGETAEANGEGDCSFSSPYIDVLSFNYPIGNTGRNDPDRYFETSIELRKIRSNLSLLNKLKPILMTESAGVFDAECDVTDSEWIRDLFVSSFTGLAGAGMPWGYQYGARPDLSYWQEWLAGFFEDVDLNSGVWFPELNQALIGGEVLWLHNVATGERVGIMQNRRYNFYHGSVGAEYIWKEDEDGNPIQVLSKCGKFKTEEHPEWLLQDNQWDDYGVTYATTGQFVDGAEEPGHLRVFDPMNASPTLSVYEGPVSCANCPFGVVFTLDEVTPYLLFKYTPYGGRLSTPEPEYSEETISEQIAYTAQSQRIRMWPNPAKSQLSISVGPVAENGMVEFYDVSNRMVFEIALSHTGITEMDISTLDAGSYFVRVLLTKGKETWKRLEVL